jgi:hypothetical protein
MNLTNHKGAKVMDNDTEHQFITHASNPSYISAHRIAFQTTDAPTNLKVGDHVWIIDHYYPGLVIRASAAEGRAVVKTWWDADEPDELEYTTADYKQLRVDASEASRAFWPSGVMSGVAPNGVAIHATPEA